ncbi:MAG: dihydropteroate synthase [Nitrospirae bacterium]|nr:dihydropteroate synthase [Nitrospirota bacterium]
MQRAKEGFALEWSSYRLDLTRRTHIMGILNVTPDSFSDGGLYLDTDKAVERSFEIEKEGADMIDIGGESTRPGALPLSPEEELSRVIPVIEKLKSRLRIPISIDTYKAEVAREAIKAGASIINDISGLRFDPEMATVAAEYDVPVVIMHIKGTPRDMQINPVYQDLIGEILHFLEEGISIALKAGVDDDMIIIDPGIGFGKTFEHNLEIINRLDKFRSLGMPILLGPSRKSFIGKILDLPPGDRLEGTAAAVAIGIMKGASIVRVHDVSSIVRVARVVDAITHGGL